MLIMSRPVGVIGAGDHACLSFASDIEQRDVVTRFVARGLAGRERVYYSFGTDPVAVLKSLEAGGVAAGDAVDKGQLMVLGAEDAYPPGGFFDPEVMTQRLHQLIDEALRDGYAGFRVAAEMTWMLRQGLDAEAIVSYEKRATTVFSTRPASGLCQYDRRRFPAAVMAAAEAAHPHVATADPLYADAQVTLTPVYDPLGLRVAGEIDLTNSRAWQSALAAVADRGEQVHLELAELGFIDVPGVRALARVAADMADGHRLVVDSAPPELLRILEITGWNSTTNLVIGAR